MPAESGLWGMGVPGSCILILSVILSQKKQMTVHVWTFLVSLLDTDMVLKRQKDIALVA